MEKTLWLEIVSAALGVSVEQLVVGLVAAAAGILGGLLPGAAGAALRKLSEWLSSKRP